MNTMSPTVKMLGGLAVLFVSVFVIGKAWKKAK